MTWPIAYVLVLLVVGLILFSRETLPLDVVALILLLLLVLPPAEILTPVEALSGFGSETIVTLVGLFVVTAGVTRTGVVERLGLRVAGLAREHPVAVIRLLLSSVTVISSFLSNTVTTAAMMPFAIGSSRRAGLRASQVLMPLAFASILAGGVTLISTSTNLVVSGELPKYGLEPIGFFEMAPVGLVIVVLGLLYLFFIAPKLMPERGAAAGAEGDSFVGATARTVRRIFQFDWFGPRTVAGEQGPKSAPGPAKASGTAASPGAAHDAQGEASEGSTGPTVIERYGLRHYLTEVIVTKASPLVGKPLGETPLAAAMDLSVIGVRRGEQRTLVPRPNMLLQEGDVLLVEGGADEVLAIKDAVGIELRPDFQLSEPDLQSEGVRMLEAMVLPRSELLGGTLRDVRFHETTGVTVLGIHARERGFSALVGAGRRARLSRHRLESGDMLLLQGSPENLDRLDGNDLMLLGDRSAHHARSHKATLASLIFVGAMVLATTQLLPLSVALLTAIPVLILSRCITSQEAYESVDWRLLVLIAAMMAFGTAMAKTGAAGWMADLLVAHVSSLGTYAVLITLFLLTLVLTQPMSNQAAALVLLPVAIDTAQTLGVDPRPMVMAVTFAASCSFLTPLEPSCVLVYGPGNYRFFDFVRVGGLLTLIVFVVVALLIPVFWPLTPLVGP
ncbi:MAG: SLC13 family permease [Planctomycetota bacterium]